MGKLPKSTTTAIALSVGAMLQPLAISQAQIDGALAALFSELDGTGTRTITNREPLDRVLTRKQAADISACSTKTITERIKAGKLRGIYGGKDGKRITGISEASLRTFLAGKEA